MGAVSTEGWKSLTVEVGGRHPHVALVTLTGPGKGNAMGPDFWAEMPLLFAQLDADPQVRSVVLTGAGKHFSFGLDLMAMGPMLAPLIGEDKAMAGPRTEFHNTIKAMQEAVNRVADCRKPVVAAISG